jgi:hypothetical protein
MAIRYEECGVCNGAGKVQGVDPMDNSVITVGCNYCFGDGRLAVEYIASPLSASVRDPEGRLIRAATDVARAQRAKGIAKYNSTLEDQNGYTIGGMIDMVAEELADGSVYVQKVREMYLALLDEIERAADNSLVFDAQSRINRIREIIKRERNRA